MYTYIIECLIFMEQYHLSEAIAFCLAKWITCIQANCLVTDRHVACLRSCKHPQIHHYHNKHYHHYHHHFHRYWRHNHNLNHFDHPFLPSSIPPVLPRSLPLPPWPFIHPSIHPPIHPSIIPSVCPSVLPSFLPPSHPSTHHCHPCTSSPSSVSAWLWTSFSSSPSP